jgi:predicted esterase
VAPERATDPPHIAAVADSGPDISAITWPGHTGVLLVPASTLATLPLLLLYDPGGGARRIVERYAPAARKLGWLAASCNQVANGTPDDADTEAMLGLLQYVRGRRGVDRTRVFAGGFSGGACGAYRLAIVESDVVSGAIVECGHMAPWREVGGLATSALRFYLFSRTEDFNLPATRQLAGAMKGRGCRATLVVQPGAHAPMEGADVEEALAWMGG